MNIGDSLATSGREVINDLFKGKPACRIPSLEFFWKDTLEKWIEQGMPKEWGDDPVSCFDLDMAECGGWFDWKPKIGVEEIVEENSEWKIVRNGSGALLKWWKNKSGTPEHVDFHMTTHQIWEKEYKPLLKDFDPQRFKDIQAIATNLKKYKNAGKWTYMGNQFIWENMRQSMGDYTMYISLADDPEWIHDFNRTYTAFYKKAFKYVFEKVGLPDGVWLFEDLGYKDRLFCNPEVLETLIFPYYKEMVDFFHSYGLFVVLHSCGYQKPAIPLIIAAGFDALNPMEVKAGNNIFEYVEQFGDRLAFVGGLDERVLETGDQKLIRKTVIDFIEGMKQREARFVYASDHSISTRVNFRDFLYSLEVYKEYQ